MTDVQILYAFAHEGQGGNPAGVVLDADPLSTAQKQAIAAQVGLSETAFVSRSQVADFKLEFFTSTRQIAHCGHATIATFSHLRQIGRVQEGATSKETIDGRREILIEGDQAFMEQQAPGYFVPHEVPAARIAASLGLAQEALDREHPPVVCSTGNRFLLVKVRDAAALAGVRADLHEVASVSDALDLVGYYAWAPGAGWAQATTRMFAPRYGISEEAGTGMAAGPLACYLHDRCGIEGRTLLIQQGCYMAEPSPSRIEVRLDLDSAGAIRRLFAGGRARVGDRIAIPV